MTHRGQYRGTGSDVTKPEVTSKTGSGVLLGPRGQGNCPIATKLGTNLEYNIDAPEVTSLNRKRRQRTGSDVTDPEVRSFLDLRDSLIVQ